jgi:thiol:disulfide interchange protein DsbD
MNTLSLFRIPLRAAALFGGFLVLLSAAFAAPPAVAQESAESRAADIVKTSLTVAPSPVAQSADFELKIVATVSRGYHVNAHKTSDEYLIPTTITLQLPSGVTQREIIYPAAKLAKLAFSDKPINVYDGVAILRVRLHAAADAPLGPASLPIRLRYQACNESTCFPPVNLPLTASFTIAPASTAPGH